MSKIIGVVVCSKCGMVHFPGIVSCEQNRRAIKKEREKREHEEFHKEIDERSFRPRRFPRIG